MSDVRTMLSEFKKGMETLGKEIPEQLKAFTGFVGTVQKEGALTAKEKELIAVALGIARSCDTCVVARTVSALKAGCTKQQILEAAAMAIAFAGLPAVASSATLLVQTLEEFGSKDTVAVEILEPPGYCRPTQRYLCFFLSP